MAQSNTRFFYHFNWATYRRAAMITKAIERPLYRCIETQVINAKGTVLAVNGMPDHVHLVVQHPATVAPATLMQSVKGVSSAFGRKVLQPGELFG